MTPMFMQSSLASLTPCLLELHRPSAGVECALNSSWQFLHLTSTTRRTKVQLQSRVRLCSSVLDLTLSHVAWSTPLLQYAVLMRTNMFRMLGFGQQTTFCRRESETINSFSQPFGTIFEVRPCSRIPHLLPPSLHRGSGGLLRSVRPIATEAKLPTERTTASLVCLLAPSVRQPGWATGIRSLNPGGDSEISKADALARRRASTCASVISGSRTRAPLPRSPQYRRRHREGRGLALWGKGSTPDESIWSP